MAIRINRVYTRSGDLGDTGLVGGERVAKDDPRIEAFGSLDELNSALGIALAEIASLAPAAEIAGAIDELRATCLWAQQRLFDLGAYLATPPKKFQSGMPNVRAEDVERLEKTIDRWGEPLPELTSFVLPGGGKAGAWLHFARTLCRRAERRIVRLHRDSPLDARVLAFVNRLSDFLFVAARHASRLLGEAEVLWQPGARKP
jgi:cob(I)alamin adenosyltransferase